VADSQTLLGSSGKNISSTNCNYIKLIGNVNPQGSLRPDSMALKPTSNTNYTQIFRDAAEITNSVLGENVGNEEAAWAKRQKDALVWHAGSIENAILFGRKSERTGTNNQPETTTGGILEQIRDNVPTNIRYYNLETDTFFQGKTWLNGGLDWVEMMLGETRLYSNGYPTALGYIGQGALTWIGRAIKAQASTNISMTAGSAEYGLNVTRLVTINGTIDLYTHPQFSRDPIYTNAMMIINPASLVWRTVSSEGKSRDTHFQEAMRDAHGMSEGGFDGRRGEWFTDGGVQVNEPDTFAMLYGFGQDNNIAV
jgi:hypothetical protein